MQSNPNQTLPKRNAEFVPSNSLFSVGLSPVLLNDPETLHEVQVVISNLVHLEPFVDGVAFLRSEHPEAPGGVLNTYTTRTVGLIEINNALRAIADRHNTTISYTYGPLATIRPTIDLFAEHAGLHEGDN